MTHINKPIVVCNKPIVAWFSSIIVFLFAGCLLPATLLGQAAVDLKSGSEALQAGDLDTAKSLLESAAQDLPESVEAQMALAECYLKLGQLDSSIGQYRKVLQLSPDHVQANAIVKALTGQHENFEQKLASAKALMLVGAYSEAAGYLHTIVDDAATPQQRATGWLMQLEALLWSGNQKQVLTGALELAETSDDRAIIGPARIIAALAMLQRIEQNKRWIGEAGKLAKLAGNVQEPWASRSKLVEAFAELTKRETANQASVKLRVAFAEIPGLAYRTWAQSFAANHLLQAASESMGQGSTQRALEIVWPMLSTNPIPAADQVLKPIELEGGWLDDELTSPKLRARISRVFTYIGQTGIRQSGPQATLLGYWLAAEYNRQAGSLTEGTEVLLNIAGELAHLSRPATKRQPGEPLAAADQLQKSILLNTATRITNDKQKAQLVDLILGQLKRYEQSGDLAAGLGQFVAVADEDDPSLTAELPMELVRLGPGAAHRKLLLALAQGYARLGIADFAKAAATLRQAANESLNQNDRISLTMLSQLRSTYFDHESASAQARELVERYSAGSHWPAAFSAIDIFHANQADESGRWAAAQLKLRQATTQEDRRLATNRKLGETLSNQVREAIDDVVAIVESDTRVVTRKKATTLAQSLVTRYAGLQRTDLAGAVVVALATAGEGKLLADWALWSRINLLELQANRSLSSQAKQLVEGQVATLEPFHETELKLINQLLAEYDDSEYRSPAVNRVSKISGNYQKLRSYEVATKILQDFLQATTGLTRAEQIEYQVVQIALHKARHAFSQREENDKPPGELSAEYTNCIDLLSEFLTAWPTGDYSTDAETQLFGVVTVYGGAGAWNVAREILDRFATAIPDFRRPQHLKMLKAATWLGELDQAYGNALLTPASGKSPAFRSWGPIDGLAVADRPDASEEGKADDDFLMGGEIAEQPNQASGGDAGGYDFDGSRTARGGRESEIAMLIEPNFEVFHAEIRSQPSENALAMIRQSQQRQYQQLAMMEDARVKTINAPGQSQDVQIDLPVQQGMSISLPTGSILSEAEMQRQNEAADKAYAILLDIIRTASPHEAAITSAARAHVMWLFGFFEGQLRADQAIVLINRYLKDQPNDPAKVALAFQAINNQLTWAAQRQPSERVNLAWLDKRHEMFELARESIKLFILDFGSDKTWVDRAQLLTADSYQQEADMTAPISPVRAGGLLVRSADALITLLQTQPDNPHCGGFDQRMWNVAERLRGLGQRDAAIYVLSQIPIRFPTNPIAQQSVLRIAELHAADLSQPLKAVETYQEFLSLNGDNEQVRSQIFSIAQQLAGRQRYLESLHVYGVFVDSFPTDARAAEALQAMGKTHQTNEAWDEAIQSYQRVLSEYAGSPIVPQVKLAVAECQINVSRWRDARKLYEEFVAQYSEDGQTATAKRRLDWLKKLDRYETLLADEEVQRHKDDAQFEIGRIVLTQFNNQVKAIQEFGKVVANYPNSDLADDAQLEIGKAWLALNRLTDAREALLRLPAKYPTSPLADDALYLVAQSYEQQASGLATATLRGVRALAFDAGQKGAYQDFNESADRIAKLQAKKRIRLKSEGKNKELALNEAAQSFRQGNLAISGLANTARRAEQQAETESALQVANRQDRINEANREAVKLYMQAATDYPLGDKTDDSLLRIAQIFETQLKDRPAAMETYQKIVKLFPGTPVAEDAAWNVAMFHEQEGQYEKAVSSLRDFIRSYPASGQVADAQYSLAENLEELGRWVDAMDEYETFRQKFSDHPKAVVAQDQINWIRTYRK